jgi:hypothetical protein
MQKTTTSLNKADLIEIKCTFKNLDEMRPSDQTIQKIMQFASNYRAIQLNQDQHIDLILS